MYSAVAFALAQTSDNTSLQESMAMSRSRCVSSALRASLLDSRCTRIQRIVANICKWMCQKKTFKLLAEHCPLVLLATSCSSCTSKLAMVGITRVTRVAKNYWDLLKVQCLQPAACGNVMSPSAISICAVSVTNAPTLVLHQVKNLETHRQPCHLSPIHVAQQNLCRRVGTDVSVEQ